MRYLVLLMFFGAGAVFAQETVRTGADVLAASNFDRLDGEDGRVGRESHRASG